ncbi:MAG: alkaline phosphatase family protein [Elusimicrobia bacterium]|nr:alkaline phosphatase family protein [Elusimicrobiota bacterium]
MENRKRKNIIIGLDGATWDVLDGFIGRGLMPNLARLRQEGSWGGLRSTVPPLTPPAWVSFMTGCNPGKTGICGFTKRSLDGSNTYYREYINSGDIGVPTVWDILSSFGRKVISVNVPMTFPVWEINGCMISGMMTPSESEVYTYPARLKEELAKNGISYRIDYMLHGRAEKKKDSAYLDRIDAFGAKLYFDDLADLLKKRMAAVNYLMVNREWDYFMFVIVGMDRIQHHLWDYIADEYKDPEVTRNIHAYYGEVDNCIGKIMAQNGEEANYIVLSDHGFAKLEGNLGLNFWLREKGYLVLDNREKGRAMVKNVISKLGINPRRLAEMILGKRKTVSEQKKTSGVDWKNTKAFSSDRDSITVNLKGRETDGIVEESDYPCLVAEIISALKSDRLISEKHILKDIHRSKDIYSGDRAVGFPDMILEFGGPGGSASSPFKSYREKNLFSRDGWSQGEHAREGIFVMKGPEVKRNRGRLLLDITDLLPNILYLNGENIPRHLDGRVENSLYAGGFTEINKPRYAEYAPGKPGGRKYGYSEEEAKKIEARLKSLGYM